MKYIKYCIILHNPVVRIQSFFDNGIAGLICEIKKPATYRRLRLASVATLLCHQWICFFPLFVCSVQNPDCVRGKKKRIFHRAEGTVADRNTQNSTLNSARDFLTFSGGEYPTESLEKGRTWTLSLRLSQLRLRLTDFCFVLILEQPRLPNAERQHNHLRNPQLFSLWL